MTIKAGKYDICTECGATLDHGEQCDCGEQDKPVENRTSLWRTQKKK